MRHHSSISKATALYTVSVVGFFAGLHASLPSYFNSSFLTTFTSENTVSLIYFIMSLVTIIGLLSMNMVLRKLGNFRTALLLILIQMGVFYGLMSSDSFKTVAILFIIGMSIVSLISFTLDIFLEKSTDLHHTGGIRGLYMTAINAAWIFGPLIGGMLISGNNYKGVYIAAFSMLFPLLYLVHKNFNKFTDSRYIKLSVRETVMRILRNRDVTRIFIINIALQTFYAWMIVYTPIYLHEHIGFGWGEISIIFTIMLIPFILIELPLGKLADRKWGEKEMLAIGFTIMGISTAALIFFTSKNLALWAIMLFITRIGAATAEIVIETYFFKKVDNRDPEVLSMFRITRPMSFFIAPVITVVGLAYTTDQYLFLALGLTCLLTLYPILTIRDTN